MPFETADELAQALKVPLTRANLALMQECLDHAALEIGYWDTVMTARSRAAVLTAGLKTMKTAFGRDYYTYDASYPPFLLTGVPPPVTILDQLLDVDTTTTPPVQGDTLVYNATLGLWVPGLGTPGPAGPMGPAGPTGAQGVAGAQGIAGLDGPTGPTGPQGVIGPTGPVGPSITIIGEVASSAALPDPTTRAVGDGYITTDTGHLWVVVPGPPQVFDDVGTITGPPGPQGIQGVQGVQGDPGPQGIQGVVGPQGVIGPTGLDGPLGPTGPTGPPGANINLIGSVADFASLPDPVATTSLNPGDSYTTQIDGHLWVLVAGPPRAWSDAGAIVGPPGPQGLAGPTGPTGPTGADSTVPGPQGVQGSQGVAGPQGITGPTGPPGASVNIIGSIPTAANLPPTNTAGLKSGDAYVASDTGHLYAFSSGPPAQWVDTGRLQGPAGPAGVQGPAGTNGAMGPVGPQGPQGVSGVQGLQGIQGPPGPGGVPLGGVTGAVLTKLSATDQDAGWVPVSVCDMDFNGPANFPASTRTVVTFATTPAPLAVGFTVTSGRVTSAVAGQFLIVGWITLRAANSAVFFAVTVQHFNAAGVIKKTRGCIGSAITGTSYAQSNFQGIFDVAVGDYFTLDVNSAGGASTWNSGSLAISRAN